MLTSKFTLLFIFHSYNNALLHCYEQNNTTMDWNWYFWWLMTIKSSIATMATVTAQTTHPSLDNRQTLILLDWHLISGNHKVQLRHARRNSNRRCPGTWTLTWSHPPPTQATWVAKGVCLTGVLSLTSRIETVTPLLIHHLNPLWSRS